jgi:hypothetical protein
MNWKLNGAPVRPHEARAFQDIADRTRQEVIVQNVGGWPHPVAERPIAPLDYLVFFPKRFDPEHPDANPSTGFVGARAPELVVQQHEASR